MAKEKTPKPLEQFVEERAQAKFEEHEKLLRETRAAKAAAREAEEQMLELQKKLELVEFMKTLHPEPPTWLAPKTPTKENPAIPTLLLADIHWDERIKPEQVDGINAYDRKIAEQRVRRAFEGAIVMCRDRFRGYNYEGIMVAGAGDWFSGIIHPELLETNEAPIMESVLSLLECIEAGMHMLVREFKQLYFRGVGGNHGRRTVKPVFKNRAQDNFDWLVYKLIERDFRGVNGVSMDISEAMDAQYQLYNTRYLLTHGDQFRGGSGISAALAPLMLGTHRKTRRQAAAGKPYDLMVMGHWHQKLALESKGLIVGGCICGFNEFAYGMNYEPEPPQAALWLTTPQGLTTGVQSVMVSDRAAEGW